MIVVAGFGWRRESEQGLDEGGAVGGCLEVVVVDGLDVFDGPSG
ncbi:hypothetical protein [Streptomyces sp. H27-S2]|nr:hypothetical protein [Streptomyces sp. H27-S2]MCY0950335.1 hypothetical protein [Streptomyces sp. H27-S2]